jgi:hypothetical protein
MLHAKNLRTTALVSRTSKDKAVHPRRCMGRWTLAQYRGSIYCLRLAFPTTFLHSFRLKYLNLRMFLLSSSIHPFSCSSHLEHRALFGVSVITRILRHTAGLLWTSDQPVLETSTYTGQPKRQTSMPSAGFEPATPASKRPQTYGLDRAATGIGQWDGPHFIIFNKLCFDISVSLLKTFCRRLLEAILHVWCLREYGHAPASGLVLCVNSPSLSRLSRRGIKK